MSDGYLVVQLCKKKRSYYTPLLNDNLIFKNLAFCTLSRNNKFDFRVGIFAEIGEKVGRESEPNLEILVMCRVLLNYYQVLRMILSVLLS